MGKEHAVVVLQATIQRAFVTHLHRGLLAAAAGVNL